MTASQPFGERSMAGQMKLPAALLTSVSAGPKRSPIASKKRVDLRRIAHVRRHGQRLAAGLAHQATVSSSGSGRRPQTATRAALRPEVERERPAHAAAAARDGDHPPVDAARHVPSSSSGSSPTRSST